MTTRHPLPARCRGRKRLEQAAWKSSRLSLFSRISGKNVKGAAGYGLKTRLYCQEIICEAHAMLYRILLALLLLTQLSVASARDLSAPYRSEMVTIRPGLENLQLASGNKSFDGDDIFQVYNDWQLIRARPVCV